MEILLPVASWLGESCVTCGFSLQPQCLPQAAPSTWLHINSSFWILRLLVLVLYPCSPCMPCLGMKCLHFDFASKNLVWNTISFHFSCFVIFLHFVGQRSLLFSLLSCDIHKHVLGIFVHTSNPLVPCCPHGECKITKRMLNYQKVMIINLICVIGTCPYKQPTGPMLSACMVNVS